MRKLLAVLLILFAPRVLFAADIKITPDTLTNINTMCENFITNVYKWACPDSLPDPEPENYDKDKCTPEALELTKAIAETPLGAATANIEKLDLIKRITHLIQEIKIYPDYAAISEAMKASDRDYDDFDITKYGAARDLAKALSEEREAMKNATTLVIRPNYTEVWADGQKLNVVNNGNIHPHKEIMTTLNTKTPDDKNDTSEDDIGINDAIRDYITRELEKGTDKEDIVKALREETERALNNKKQLPTINAKYQQEADKLRNDLLDALLAEAAEIRKLKSLDLKIDLTFNIVDIRQDENMSSLDPSYRAVKESSSIHVKAGTKDTLIYQLMKPDPKDWHKDPLNTILDNTIKEYNDSSSTPQQELEVIKHNTIFFRKFIQEYQAEAEQRTASRQLDEKRKELMTALAQERQAISDIGEYLPITGNYNIPTGTPNKPSTGGADATTFADDTLYPHGDDLKTFNDGDTDIKELVEKLTDQQAIQTAIDKSGHNTSTLRELLRNESERHNREKEAAEKKAAEEARNLQVKLDNLLQKIINEWDKIREVKENIRIEGNYAQAIDSSGNTINGKIDSESSFATSLKTGMLYPHSAGLAKFNQPNPAGSEQKYTDNLRNDYTLTLPDAHTEKLAAIQREIERATHNITTLDLIAREIRDKQAADAEAADLTKKTQTTFKNIEDIIKKLNFLRLIYHGITFGGTWDNPRLETYQELNFSTLPNGDRQLKSQKGFTLQSTPSGLTRSDGNDTYWNEQLNELNEKGKNNIDLYTDAIKGKLQDCYNTAFKQDVTSTINNILTSTKNYDDIASQWKKKYPTYYNDRTKTLAWTCQQK